MKNYLRLFLVLVLLNCSDTNNQENCNFLLNVGVNATINLNLPQFSQLQFIGNSVRLEGQGNGGIIIARTGSETLRAWDGADPNHSFSSCSLLSVNGLTATCGCEDANQYELLSGQIMGNNPQPCTLLGYRIEPIGNNQFLISN
jgi:hypothetical protein